MNIENLNLAQVQDYKSNKQKRIDVCTLKLQLQKMYYLNQFIDKED